MCRPLAKIIHGPWKPHRWFCPVMWVDIPCCGRIKRWRMMTTGSTMQVIPGQSTVIRNCFKIFNYLFCSVQYHLGISFPPWSFAENQNQTTTWWWNPHRCWLWLLNPNRLPSWLVMFFFKIPKMGTFNMFAGQYHPLCCWVSQYPYSCWSLPDGMCRLEQRLLPILMASTWFLRKKGHQLQGKSPHMFRYTHIYIYIICGYPILISIYIP